MQRIGVMQRPIRMNHALKHLGEEIRKIRRIIDDVQTYVELLEQPRYGSTRLLRINEREKRK